MFYLLNNKWMLNKAEIGIFANNTNKPIVWLYKNKVSIELKTNITMFQWNNIYSHKKLFNSMKL